MNERIVDAEEAANLAALKANETIEKYKEQALSNEHYKNLYLEQKNRLELITLKLNSASDENYNLKRDIFMCEKENKNKTEIIEKLRLGMLDAGNRGFYPNESLNFKPVSYDNFDYDYSNKRGRRSVSPNYNNQDNYEEPEPKRKPFDDIKLSKSKAPIVVEHEDDSIHEHATEEFLVDKMKHLETELIKQLKERERVTI